MTADTPAAPSAPLTVYYDGSCPLCTAEIAHYRRRTAEGAVLFEDVSRATGDVAPDLTRAQAMARFHVRRADGELVSGARGFIEIWRVTASWRWAARIADLPGAAGALEIAYRCFLPLRPFLQRAMKRRSRKPD